MSGVVLWISVTVVLYVAAQALYRKTATPVLHPVPLATAAVIALLAATRTPYGAYADATSALSFLLIPATASLAVLLVREAGAVRRRAFTVSAIVAVASCTTVGTALLLARALHCPGAVVASFATKAVTTPVALALAGQTGGIPALAAIFSVLSGVIGALAAAPLLARTPHWAAGAAMGSVAHGVGTAQLATISDEAAAYSGFAMGANALATAAILPLLARLFAAIAAVALAGSMVLPAAARGIAFVPLDDRPVTLQLPIMLARIAGVRVDAPPTQLLGSYLRAGSPDAIMAWLHGPQTRGDDAFVLSGDMLAYGGLVASRVPGVTYAGGFFRLNDIATVRRSPHTAIDVFTTIMRLAPTGVPASAAPFFAAYPAWTHLQEYASLHDPPLPGAEAQRAAQLQAAIGEPLLEAYLRTRARNVALNRLLIDLVRRGTIDRLILGQDDAGPHGLHVREVALLHAEAAADPRVAVEPGADELGMAMMASRLAAYAHWMPRVLVHYSTADGASYQDPLEFAPVAVPIAGLIRACGGVEVAQDPDIVLYVRVPGTSAAADAALVYAMRTDRASGRSLAVADITFLQETYEPEFQFAQMLLDAGVARDLDAYASWNTNANTAGTALAEAIAAGAGRRLGTYDAAQHRTFTFLRFLDDVYFHARVRPQLNAALDAEGVSDHTLLDGAPLTRVAALNRALLWNDAQALLPRLYPGTHLAAIDISLPWNRTFETRIDAAIAPDLQAGRTAR